jgi:hypothetical protein
MMLFSKGDGCGALVSGIDKALDEVTAPSVAIGCLP